MSRRSRLLAGVAALALLPALTPAADAAPAQAPEPHTYVPFPTGTTTTDDGDTVLADRHGRAVQLRGVNLGKFDDIGRADVATMGEAGFTLLRLPIQWRRLEPTQDAYDAGYVQHIRDVLRWAQRYGLKVLVDWHQDVFGPAFGFDGIPEWATRTDDIPFERVEGNWFNNYFHPAVQAAFTHLWNDEDLREEQVEAWTYLADQLEGSPALLGYDLFNEPMGGTLTFEDVLNPDPTDLITKAAVFEATDLSDMYDRLIAGIRTVDSRSWLFVEPTVLVGEGVPTSLRAFDDPRPGADRIGYAPHAYSTSVEDGEDWDTASGFVETYEAAITLYPRENAMPVVVGEWGPISGQTPGNQELVRQQTASFTRFASGWAIWYGCANEEGGGYCVFTEDGHLDAGRAAAWAPYAKVLAGTQVAESYDVDAKRYVLTYRPQRKQGLTRLVVPSGFGRLIDVRVTDGEGRAPAVVRVSRPSDTGARTIAIRVAGRVDPGSTWTVRITRG
ncbi:cellulase family glycosylhydrolase [Nocardioides sp. YIM 152588]|uniref:glycoside hydrolase family 5 protein n=1 Tax=Nocardioides sp. YIM 152588 TaxID=3158259 RepID=UPI0032E37527